MTTNRSAPVMPAAARIICSSCGRCMTQARFDFPDFVRRKRTGKRRVLAQPLALVRLGNQSVANFGNGSPQQSPPLGITTKQRWRIAILLGPPFEVRPSKIEPLRMLRQSNRNLARQLEADVVLNFVAHRKRAYHKIFT